MPIEEVRQTGKICYMILVLLELRKFNAHCLPEFDPQNHILLVHSILPEVISA